MTDNTKEVIIKGLKEIIETTKNNNQKMEAIKLLIELEREDY